VRLSSKTQTIIRDTAREIFGPQVTTMVFGSRVDDTELVVDPQTEMLPVHKEAIRTGVRL